MDSEMLNEKKRNREEKPEALASPENVSKKKKKKRKMKENEAETEQQNQQPSQVCPKPLVVATRISVEETPKKKKMKKKKSNLIGEQQELNKNKEEENGEVPNETNALAIEVPTIVEMKTEGQNQYPSQVCPQPLVVSISVEANLVDPKDTPKKKRGKKKKNKNKSDLNGEQQEQNKEEVPNETNPPKPSLAFDKSQTEPSSPIRVSLIPQTSTLQPTIPIETEQNLSKSEKKRKNKKRRVMLDDGVQPNEHNIETPVQSRMSICHTPTPTINHTMDPQPVIPICPKQCFPIEQTIAVDPAISMDEPAPQIGQTIPMNKNQRKRMNKKKNKMLNGAQPNGHDPKSTAEAPVRETIGVTVTKDPRSQMCWACRKSDHKISQCRMLKSLSKRAKVCFFCCEIGHSLGRCSVSSAGGGRFAKCLLCHADGHFSYNCPGDGHGNCLKLGGCC